MVDARTRGKVLSIVGAGRSGTTILASILGQTDGVFSAGELRWLWSRDLTQQRLCACGRTPSECLLWSRVVEQTLGVRPDHQHTARMGAAVRSLVQAQTEMAARKNRLRVLRGASGAMTQVPGLEQVKGATTELLSALFRATGAHTVVDASKRPEEAAVLASTRCFDHYVLHMVRDSRAVVHSWNRTKTVQTVEGLSTLASRRPGKTISQWMENSAGAEVLRRNIPREKWLFLRYEDFVQRPRDAVLGVLAFLGEGAAPPFSSADTVELGVGHELSGNPSRFATGPVTITPDNEWSERMPRRDQVLIQAATFPFLLRYGYLVPGAKAKAA